MNTSPTNIRESQPRGAIPGKGAQKLRSRPPKPIRVAQDAASPGQTVASPKQATKTAEQVALEVLQLQTNMVETESRHVASKIKLAEVLRKHTDASIDISLERLEQSVSRLDAEARFVSGTSKLVELVRKKDEAIGVDAVLTWPGQDLVAQPKEIESAEWFYQLYLDSRLRPRSCMMVGVAIMIQFLLLHLIFNNFDYRLLGAHPVRGATAALVIDCLCFSSVWLYIFATTNKYRLVNWVLTVLGSHPLRPRHNGTSPKPLVYPYNLTHRYARPTVAELAGWYRCHLPLVDHLVLEARYRAIPAEHVIDLRRELLIKAQRWMVNNLPRCSLNLGHVVLMVERSVSVAVIEWNHDAPAAPWFSLPRSWGKEN